LDVENRESESKDLSESEASWKERVRVSARRGKTDYK